MFKWTPVVLILFWICSNNDARASFRSLFLFFTDKSVRMFNVVHVALEIRITDLQPQILVKVGLIVIDIHAATFEE
jgi:hypothetical protein